ncbi:regulatory protein RecX [Nostocoides sp. HKS02]|uniref:regulatory protein RecX n=1 Tax=Nostocoides sp. HKS02 TaxID=1813880 RepID=UPI0012B4E96E|nr:regulatory protein RecX [Tetrasphaera sp. HKS02]QGN56939.1 regulatory protein RecX [Tetrasphaera sp. HKS02]
MTARHDTARAALEAALAATASDRAEARPERPDRPEPAEQSGEPNPYDVARQIALRQLALSPKSRKQLLDKLRQRNCPDDVAEAVLDRLTEVGLIDDEAFAGMLVRSQQAGRGLAKRALARELRTKGVDDETAQAALEAVSSDDERARAERLVAKRLKALHGLEPAVQTRRLAAMLARKGYPSDLVMSVVREAVANAPEHRRD